MNINLARKWRSKQFDEIVGQPLAIRLIKNSLFRNLLFPVYLLSGTRGTGKTSTARLFAAALNCARLEAFQKDPQNNTLPCLTCESCQAMQQMNHPDFIEIDAASHTGVDNVRQIIDAASFVPVMGSKKIYLIDEAHMLSKAAFNAFLKILEEPPATVVFMLATTDPHKIIQTVTSRCFQIFFDPIKPSEVIEHLTFICQQESLTIEPAALFLIAQETEGSMRDALNLLERLRSLPEVMKNDSEPSVITKQMVLDLLGSIDDDRLSELLHAVVISDVPAVLATWERLEIDRYAPGMVWKKLVETLRRALWLKQGTAPDDTPISEHLAKFVELVSYKRLVQMLDLCYCYELTFAKTAVPGTLLEVLLLKMVSQDSLVKPQTAEKRQTANQQIPPRDQSAVIKQADMKNIQGQGAVSYEKKSEQEISVLQNGEPSTQAEVQVQATGPWAGCLAELEKVSDPLVLSIFRQSTQQVHADQLATLEVTFSHDLMFFKDWLLNTKSVWQPVIDRFFGAGTELVPQFTGPSAKLRAFTPAPVRTVAKVPEKSPQQKVQGVPSPVGKPVSKEDLTGLAKSSLVMEAFPGLLLAQDISSAEGT